MKAATANIEDIYELSPLQRGMLFHTLYAPGTAVYVEQIAYHIPTAFNVRAFDSAWQVLAAAHPILRTSFFFDDLAKPLQVVHRRVQVPVVSEDWTAVPTDERKRKLEAYLHADAARGFTISEAPLVRLACFTTPNATDVVLTFHHAILDGWSLQLLMRDLNTAYDAQYWGHAPHLPFRRPYTDYIGWLQSLNLSAAEKYWRTRLKGIEAPTRLNIDTLPAPVESLTSHGAADSRLSADTTRQLDEYARRGQITINTVVQGAWALLLSRYSGESDVLFGSVVSGRPADLSGAGDMIGLFINTVPVRIDLSGDPPLHEWLKRLQEEAAQAHAYQFCPIADVQTWSDISRDKPLFETVVVFENYPGIERSDANAASTSVRHLERTNIPLTLLIVPGQQLLTRVLFDAQKFDMRVVERLLGHFERILSSIANGVKRMSEVRMTTSVEAHQLTYLWNEAAREPEREWDLVRRFESVAASHEHDTALLYGPEKVSYGELNGLANRIARRLVEVGARSESPVAVCLGRSVENVAALLAVLKLGAVYVPMDSVFPSAALRHMERAANVQFVVTRAKFVAQFVGTELPRIVVEDLAAERDPGNLDRASSTLASLMYVIFTSGSTGKPKAIAVEHRQVLNRLEWMWEQYRFTDGEVACFKTSPSFVDHLWEMLGGLLVGVPTLVISDDTAQNPELLVEALSAGRVTRLWLVPSLLRTLLACEGLRHRLPRLRFWVSSGEALAPELYNRFVDEMPGATLFNLYGTSEIWDATWFDPIREQQPYCGQIGRPIRNMRTYILLRNGEPAPIGVPGELCIGGVGVARGYLNENDINGRFVEDPFTPGRMYRTGDFCRFFPDGNIQFLGRCDHQVKVRGQRIDLAQIESILDECPGVLHSAVTLRNPDSAAARLVAYVAPSVGVSLDVRQLRGYVRERLPATMNPSGYVILEHLPQTASGKIDRTNLPVEYVEEEPLTASEPPRNEMERRLAELFGAVSGTLRVGISDNFFTDLGGNSLLATQLVSRIRDALCTTITLREFFELPTVGQLAQRVGESGTTRGAVPPIRRQPRSSDPSSADRAGSV
ncbi:MAG TPA: amino acid adenylation domain-containing protein [Bryobacteraceae bacterium]|nr:amino acid adenylation domain-containing protein [Bryobacteraceae bacterium]